MNLVIVQPPDSPYDEILLNLESLKAVPGVWEVAEFYIAGDFKEVFHHPSSQTLFGELSQFHELSSQAQCLFLNEEGNDVTTSLQYLIAGLAAFAAFQQINVTGPPIDFGTYLPSGKDSQEFKQKCLASLEVDGVSVYQYIPGVELYCLARLVFTRYFPRVVNSTLRDCRWMRIRINAYHQRLLSGLPGGRLGDSTLLQDVIERDNEEFEKQILGQESKFGTDAKVQFLLEKAQIYIMLGADIKARQSIEAVKNLSGFEYVLSGALGKRTKFQYTDISQLVVFARSREGAHSVLQSLDADGDSQISITEDGGVEPKANAPNDLDLNDDTLLESIAFTKTDRSSAVDQTNLPPELVGMQPDEQPQLKPLDQITLLTEATLKDTYSPLDKLNSEEILPYAVRVLADRPTNWQIYTQALLVRSRIESHRSRTQERSILQLQVIVDQIIADTQEEALPSPDGIPQIQVSQFLPRAKASESAPVMERLKYVHSLGAPTRWEVETELAFAWSSAGSLLSALEIFKRLRLWAEVALCYHSVGQEDKARQVIRRQLYLSSKGPEMDGYDLDAPEALEEQWDGEERTPPPPHSPRLWCILGDLDQDPTCWQRAWSISKNRYARAQRSLGEYHVRKGDLEAARESYVLATVVNRQNNETWSRLGDIDLRTGNWDGAIEAFQQSIMIDDSDAKTYSNLGTALLAKFEDVAATKKQTPPVDDTLRDTTPKTSQKDLLYQSLLAFKRGAALAHSNWKIWNNVVTIAFRMSPPSYTEVLLGMRAIIRLRGPVIGEEAVDVDILRALVMEVISRERPGRKGKDVMYKPPPGTLAKVLVQTLDDEIVPLITKRAELWMLVEKLALYRGDYMGALRAAEKAWRALYSGRGEGWVEERERWLEAVGATERLVAAYENYGGRERSAGAGAGAGDGDGDGDGGLVEPNWRRKARTAVRGVMGRGREAWQGGMGWDVLEGLFEELRE